MQLVLIRHGEALSAVQGDDEEILDDESDVLTDQGRAESAKLGEALSFHFPKATLFASTLPRAHETAIILSKYLHCDVVLDWRLAEQKFGFPRGTTRAGCRILQESGYTKPLDAFDAGESVAAHRGRVSDWLDSSLSRQPSSDPVCVVAHGGTIEHVHGCLLGAPVEAMAKAFFACRTASHSLWTCF